MNAFFEVSNHIRIISKDINVTELSIAKKNVKMAIHSQMSLAKKR